MGLMRAAWYDRQGPAVEVLRVGDLADPRPGRDEVRVRMRFSGVNPGDTKHYQCWYRDIPPFCTSATFNLSQGLSITWN